MLLLLLLLSLLLSSSSSFPSSSSSCVLCCFVRCCGCPVMLCAVCSAVHFCGLLCGAVLCRCHAVTSFSVSPDAGLPARPIMPGIFPDSNCSTGFVQIVCCWNPSSLPSLISLCPAAPWPPCNSCLPCPVLHALGWWKIFVGGGAPHFLGRGVSCRKGLLWPGLCKIPLFACSLPAAVCYTRA